MIAVELSKSPGVALVEREKRVEIMEEVKFALSGLAEDTDRQVEVGKMLAADYLVFGEIVDMAPQLLISVRMTGVKSGEIVFREKLTEKAGNYEYISGYFASALLDHFNVRVAETTAKKTEPFYSYQNPAYLGIIRTDNLYLLASLPLLPGHVVGFYEYLNIMPIPESDVYITENDSNGVLGYTFPLGEKLGMRVDAVIIARENQLRRTLLEGTGISSNDGGLGAVIDFGWNILPSISLGAGITLYPNFGENVLAFEYKGSFRVAGTLGFLYRNTNESFIFDTRIAWGNQTNSIIDAYAETITGEVMTPVFLENTLTFAFNQKRTFFLIKQLNDVSFDRVYYFGRILPAVEHFFFNWFSLRAGIEGSFSQLNDSSLLGYGAMGGFTFRIIPWGLDIDLNVSYRLRPSRAIEELLYRDLLLLLSVSLNDVFISRD